MAESFLATLIKRITFDRSGVEAEITGAVQENKKFRKRLINAGKGRFFDPVSEQLFKISDDGNRITKVFTPEEEDEINKSLPRA